ncbi:desA3, partial [Symbiodinium pilosum]
MIMSETYVLDSGFDPDQFVADIKEAKAAVGDATEADARHLQGLVLTSQVLLYGGHSLLLLGAALPSYSWVLLATGAFMISFARCMKWTIIGHHVSHGGFDKLQKSHPNALPSHYKRGVFAIGVRRFFDWMDWMLPQAWDVEHNK